MAKLTIDKLITRLEKDKRFANDFKRLSDQCCLDRDYLIETGVKDQGAAQRFLKSWGAFHKRFAFDPMSLAALMVPTRKSAASYTCTGGLEVYTTLTGTESTRLLASAKGRKGKPAEKYTRASGTTKKSAKKSAKKK